MAPKRALKRPSLTQLTKSQERIAGWLAAKNSPLRQISREVKVPEREIRKFLFQPKAKTIQRYPFNKSIQKMIRLAGNFEEYDKVTYQEIRGKKVPRYEKAKRFTLEGPIQGIEPVSKDYGSEEEQRRFSRYMQSVKSEQQLPSLQMSLDWQNYTDKYELPTSIDEIKELYAEGELSKRQVTSILSHWHSIYSDMSDDWYSDMVDEFEAYDDYE